MIWKRLYEYSGHIAPGSDRHIVLTVGAETREEAEQKFNAMMKDLHGGYFIGDPHLI